LYCDLDESSVRQTRKGVKLRLIDRHHQLTTLDFLLRRRGEEERHEDPDEDEEENLAELVERTLHLRMVVVMVVLMIDVVLDRRRLRHRHAVLVCGSRLLLLHLRAPTALIVIVCDSCSCTRDLYRDELHIVRLLIGMPLIVGVSLMRVRIVIDHFDLIAEA
jgi:hypothetical protein